jgi:hypothetical protein
MRSMRTLINYVRVLDAVSELAADGHGEGGGEGLEALVDDLGDDGVAGEALGPAPAGRRAAPDAVPAVVVLRDVLLEGMPRESGEVDGSGDGE